MNKPFLVVGGGLTGLFTSLLLSRYGYEVTLLEKAPRLAPVVRGFSSGGCRFDTGLHYSGGLDETGVISRMFRYLGIGDDLRVESLDPVGFDRIREVDSGEEFAFPIGFTALGNALKQRFPQESGGIDEYLRLVEGICNEIPYVRPGNSIAGGELFSRFSCRSLGGELQRLFRDDRLRRLLAIHGLLYGGTPDQVSFAYHASNVGFFYRSAHRLLDGGEALVMLLERELSRSGVDVRLGRDVSRVSVSPGGDFAGVTCTDGTTLEGRGCVVTIHPHQFLDMVPESALRRGYRRRLVSLPETDSAMMLFGTFGAGTSPLTRSNIFLCRENPSGDPAARFPLDSVYLSGAAGGEKQGRQGFMALSPLAVRNGSFGAELLAMADDTRYQETKQVLMKEMIDYIQHSVPEFGTGLDSLATATPRTFRRYANSPYGSLYGAMHHMKHAGPGLKTRVRNLYLAGQGVTSPGLFGTAVSALLCCGEIVGHDRVSSEVDAWQ
ncbi:MAG: hypothetical protein C0616_07230 [Desulfuromonas sp.]|nr:MAG: hypothetical protein C0616_07230 [Desulfuromonas sp.]